MQRAVRAGYGSVMVDGSRLPLEDNIECTRAVVEIAYAAGIPVEAELGAIMGHEAGPLPPYDELFESGRGFTDPAQAKRFVEETNVDWLSIAKPLTCRSTSHFRQKLAQGFPVSTGTPGFIYSAK